MKKYIFIACILSIFLIACKKKPSENGTEHATEFNSIDYKQGYGILMVMKVENLVNNTLWAYDPPGFAHCYFYDSLTYYDSMGGGKPIDIGSVSLNNIQLKKYSSFNIYTSIMYYDTIRAGFGFPLNWKITGNNNFNYPSIQISGDYPSYSGYSSLPDTIYLSTGVNIPLLNISGDFIHVHIDDGNAYTQIRVVDKPFSNVSYTSSDFVPFMATNSGNITIVVFKNNLRTLNNRVYNFRTAYQLIKRNVVFMY